MGLFNKLELEPEQPRDRLVLAFAASLARSIAGADGMYDAQELHSLNQWFPKSLLKQFGFLDGQGRLNDDFLSAKKEALLTLPASLNSNEKMHLLGVLYEMASADGEIHEKEFHLIQQAAARLDADTALLSKHLAGLMVGGSGTPPVRN